MLSFSSFQRHIAASVLIFALFIQTMPGIRTTAKASELSDPSHILILEIQTAGKTSKDEYIDLNNPTKNAISLGQWRLAKKTSSGTESSLLTVFPDILIAPEATLRISHPAEYTGIVSADLVYSTTQSLADDNVVLLYDAQKNMVDKVGMGKANDFEISPTLNPNAEAQLIRKNIEGIYQDTDNNFEDFQIKDVPSDITLIAPVSNETVETNVSEPLTTDDALLPEPNQEVETPPSLEPATTDILEPESNETSDGIQTPTTEPTYSGTEETSQDESTPSVPQNPYAPAPGDIFLSEIFPSPDSEGNEWIELYRSSPSIKNLVGFSLHDAQGMIYAFNDDHAFLENNFLVIDLSSSKLNNSGDSVFLKYENSVFDGMAYGDGQTVPSPKTNHSVARRDYQNPTDFTAWTLTSSPTKMTANVITSPTPQPQSAPSPTAEPTTPAPSLPVSTNTISPTVSPTFSTHDVLINEVFPYPVSGSKEWVEIRNLTSRILDHASWSLKDGSGKKISFETDIAPLEYGVAFSSGVLNNSGDSLSLIYKEVTIDSLTYGDYEDRDKKNHAQAPRQGESLGRTKYSSHTSADNIRFAITATPTPGQENVFTSESDNPQNQTDSSSPKTGNSTLVSDYSKLIISEIFPNPKGDDGNGEFIEIANFGDKEIMLSGVTISRGTGKPFTFDDGMKIASGKFVLLKRSQSKISLPNSNGTLMLADPNGRILDTVTYDAKNHEGHSLIWQDETWLWTASPTPGNENRPDLSFIKPQAKLLAPKSVFQNEDILFDASESTDEYSIESVAWKIYESDLLISENDSILWETSFAKQGRYKAILTITNAYGATDEKTHHFSVKKSPVVKKTEVGNKSSSDIPLPLSLEEFQDGEKNLLVKIQGTLIASPHILGKNIFTVGYPVVFVSASNLKRDLVPGDSLELIGKISETKDGKRLLIKKDEDIKVLSHGEPPTAFPISCGEAPEYLGNLVAWTGEVISYKNNILTMADESGECQVTLKKTPLPFLKEKIGVQATVTGILGQKSQTISLIPGNKDDIVIHLPTPDPQSFEKTDEIILPSENKPSSYPSATVFGVSGVAVFSTLFGWVYRKYFA